MIDLDLDDLDPPLQEDDQGAPEEFTSNDQDDFEEVRLPHQSSFNSRSPSPYPAQVVDTPSHHTTPSSSRASSLKRDRPGSDSEGDQEESLAPGGLGTGKKRKRRRTAKQKIRDKERGQRLNEEEVQERRTAKDRGPWGYAYADYVLEKYPSVEILRLPIDSELDLHATKSAYEGRVYKKGPKELCTLEWVQDQGIKVVQWDGR